MNPLTIPEVCYMILERSHPYYRLKASLACKSWYQLFKSTIKGSPKAIVKESLLLYPILPVSLQYHQPLNLFDRACQLGYKNTIQYLNLNIKRKLSPEWFTRLTCICFRYNNLYVLQKLNSGYVHKMINIMKKRANPSCNDIIKISVGHFRHEHTVEIDYFSPEELAEYLIIYKSIYPYMLNDFYDGLIGAPVDGIHRYHSIGEQLRKKIGLDKVISLCAKYLPQVQVLDTPLLIVGPHKAKNLSWMKLN